MKGVKLSPYKTNMTNEWAIELRNKRQDQRQVMHANKQVVIVETFDFKFERVYFLNNKSQVIFYHLGKVQMHINSILCWTFST